MSGKHRTIGKLNYFGYTTFTIVRKIFGERWYIVPKAWDVHRFVLSQHVRGLNPNGEKFVYCPISLLVSWSADDYDHKWCHTCQEWIGDKK